MDLGGFGNLWEPAGTWGPAHQAALALGCMSMACDSEVYEVDSTNARSIATFTFENTGACTYT